MHINSRLIVSAFSALLALSCRCSADTANCLVVDSSGKPVANATVYQIVDGKASPTTLISDNIGHFSATNSSGIQYVVDAPGYAPTGGSIQTGDNTFTLSTPISVTGKVVDSKGRPVAGAIVEAGSAHISKPEAQQSFGLQIVPLKARYTAKTDSNGNYKIDDLPSDCAVSIQLDDPRYVFLIKVTAPGDTALPVITAMPGASVTGKLVRNDGKPVGIVNIYALPDPLPHGNFNAKGVATLADGSYTITSLAPGGYIIKTIEISDTSSNDWVPPAGVPVLAKLGTVNAAPDIVLASGAIVTGSFLDADTKKAISGVHVIIQDSTQSPNTKIINLVTGEDGSFVAHLWSGAATLISYAVPSDYESNPSATKRTINGVEGITTAVDPILIKRAPAVTGTVTDDSGKILPNLAIRAQLTGNNYDGSRILPATSGPKGEFALHQMKPGSYWLDPGAAWVVVSPKTFAVPLTSPLNLVLKKVQTTILKGKVVDTNGAPVAGADLTFNVNRTIATGEQSGNWVYAKTDQNGEYSLPDAPAAPNMVRRVSCTKDVFAYRSGGDITAADGQLSITPIVMVQINGKVTGTVYNGLGKPVAGAWVYSPDSDVAGFPVQADPAGHFTITGLAVGPLKIYAAKGLFSASLTAQALVTPANSAIHLSSMPSGPLGESNLTRATAMLSANFYSEASKPNQDQESLETEAARVIAEVSPDAAMRFILSIAPVNASVLDAVVSARVGVDPVGVASWAVMPTRRMNGGSQRGMLAVEIGLAAAPYDKTAALPYYDIASKDIPLTNLNSDSIGAAIGLTSLAYALDEPAADDDYAKVSVAIAALTEKAKTDASTAQMLSWKAPNWVAALAKGNPKLAKDLTKELPADDAVGAVQITVSGLVKANPSAALDFYQLFANLKDTPPKTWAQAQSLCAVLPALYKSDPKSALAQARAIKVSEETTKALTILADLMPIASAAPIYEEAEADAPSTESSPVSPSCVAYHAWLRDKTLGEKLYKEAFTKFNNSISMDASPEDGPCSADFAFYYAPIDPAFSRMVIERRFLADNRAANYNSDFNAAVADCCAMASIDINRAGDLAKSITDDNGRYSAYVKIAQYILLTPQQRQQIPFASWGNMSNWTPGSEGN
jgi:hypothetical protein